MVYIVLTKELQYIHITTYMGIQVHTLNKLHWKMGHISHAVIKCLVEQKILLGLN